MVRDIIDKAIKSEGIIEMEYSKDGFESKFYQLGDVEYSAEYGDKCFCGTPLGSDRELTFRIDRIKNIQLMWNDLFCENVLLDKEGLYIFEFVGDNYIDFIIRRFGGGEELSNHSYRKYLDLLDYEDLLSYHYLPYYSEYNTSFWKKWDVNDKVAKVNYDAIYVFAYIIEDKIKEENDYISIPSSERIKNLEYSGIHYTAVRLKEWESLDDINISESVSILGYSRFCHYTMKQLGMHNDIMWKKYHKE